MKRTVLIAVLLGSLSLVANAAVVLPYTAGSANGYQNVAGMNDAQPATPPTLGTTEDAMGNAFGFYTSDPRAVYIDFGANYASVTVQQVILGLKQWGTEVSGTPTCFWSTEPDEAFDGSDVAAPDFFFNWTSATSNKSWQETWSGSVTPAHQYYIVAFNGTQTFTNRAQEAVFVGEVPEPATMALLAFGGIAALIRRRR